METFAEVSAMERILCPKKIADIMTMEERVEWEGNGTDAKEFLKEAKVAVASGIGTMEPVTTGKHPSLCII